MACRALQQPGLHRMRRQSGNRRMLTPHPLGMTRGMSQGLPYASHLSQVLPQVPSVLSHLQVYFQGSAKQALPTQLCRHGPFRGVAHTSIATLSSSAL